METVMTEFEREIALIKRIGLKTSSLRLEYENKVYELRSMPEKLKEEGYSEDQIARAMHEKRRELGRQYKEAAPPLFREYIYAATATSVQLLETLVFAGLPGDQGRNLGHFWDK